jgi:plasmid stabilization system protein ParE
MILLSPDAVLDIERLRSFLAPKSLETTRRALSAVWRAIESLLDFPGLGAPTDDPEIRQLVIRFGSSAYIVRYMVLTESEDILVLRVWHGRDARS